MAVTARYDVSAVDVTAHDFTAAVRVFPEDRQTKGFISLSLEIGKARIQLFLPPDAYPAAREIADIWPRLGDRQKRVGNGVQLSPEALALVGDLREGAAQ